MKAIIIACAVVLAARLGIPEARAEGATSTKRVAVLEFQGPIPPETLQVITDSARVGALDVASSLGLVVMTRESLAVILKDMGKSPGACRDGDCEVETGRLVNADLIVTGIVSRVEARYVVTVKTHETKGGALLKSEQVDSADQFQLLASVKDATRRCLEPREGGTTGNVVYSLAQGKDAPATASAAIDAAYAARKFAICSKLDTGVWAFCEGGKDRVTENEFARRYRATTSLRDLDDTDSRRNWLPVVWKSAAFVGLAGLSTWSFLEADKIRDEVVGVDSHGNLEYGAGGTKTMYQITAIFSGVGGAIMGVWSIYEWTQRDGSPHDHVLSVPAARGAVDRYNGALKENLRHDLGASTEPPKRREAATVTVFPYLSPLGAGIAGAF